MALCVDKQFEMPAHCWCMTDDGLAKRCNNSRKCAPLLQDNKLALLYCIFFRKKIVLSQVSEQLLWWGKYWNRILGNNYRMTSSRSTPFGGQCRKKTLHLAAPLVTYHTICLRYTADCLLRILCLEKWQWPSIREQNHLCCRREKLDTVAHLKSLTQPDLKSFPLSDSFRLFSFSNTNLTLLLFSCSVQGEWMGRGGFAMYPFGCECT